MSGKGSNRRREDTAKVEANWPENWSARETERQQDQAFVEQQLVENLRRADLSLRERYPTSASCPLNHPVDWPCCICGSGAIDG